MIIILSIIIIISSQAVLSLLSLLSMPRRVVARRGASARGLAPPPGLREGQRAVPEGAGLQHQVPDYEAVRGRGQGEQLQHGGRLRGQGRVPKRHGLAQTEPAVQLPV